MVFAQQSPYFLDELSSKKLYAMQNQLDEGKPETLNAFYAHFVRCLIAESILDVKKDLPFAKQEVVNFAQEAFPNQMFDDRDASFAQLKTYSYKDFVQNIPKNFGFYPIADITKLSDNLYQFYTNTGSTGAASYNTLIVKGEKYSREVPNYLEKYTDLLVKNKLIAYTDTYDLSKNGLTPMEINGKPYLSLTMRTMDGGIELAVPTPLNDRKIELPALYKRYVMKSENEPKWKILK